MVRLTSAIWFAVFMRCENERGAFVTVAKKGAQQAGAIYVLHDHRDGTNTLYAPAPQALVKPSETSDRCFEIVLAKGSRDDATNYLEKQKNFDPDLWIVETEGGKGEPCLEVVELGN